MRRGDRNCCAVVMATAAVTAASHGAIRAQTGASYLQVLQTHGPSVLAETPGEFSFFIWLRRTASGPDAMFILEAPGAFDLLVDPQDQSIRLHRGGDQVPPLELVLALHDGNGQVPVGEWMLIGVSWDGAAGDFRAWARSESVARVDDAVLAPGFAAAGMDGDLTLGNPQRGGTTAQQGDYGLIVFRDHAVDGGDFDDVWDGRDYFGGYRTDNQAGGGNLNGTAGFDWMANHAILTNPDESIGGSLASAALPGDDVASDNYCVFIASNPDSTLGTTGTVTGLSSDADAFQYFSPYDDGNTFFVRQVPLEPIPDPPYVAHVSPKIRQLAYGDPQQLLRCVVSANSRGVKISDADDRTWPEQYSHGFIQARLGQVAGVLNRPARLNGTLRWFGLDTTDSPAKTGVIVSLTKDGAQGSFARLWSNSPADSIGPGDGLWLDQDATYALKARPEPGSLFVAEAPLVVRAYLLRFPGAGTLSWRPVQAASQHLAGTFGPARELDLNPAGTLTRVLGEQDLVDASGAALVLEGDYASTITPGHAVYVSAGPGQPGVAVISAVDGDGLTTTITLEHGFTELPETGSTLVFGPWEIATVEYEWPALSESDPEQWRGLELTAVGGPVVNFAWDAWRPGVNGFVFGGAGWGGNGYTAQLTEAVAAATPAWMQALEPDIWLEGIANQNSLPSSLNDYLNEIRNALPDAEVAWLGDGEHMGGTATSWHLYMLGHAPAAGVAVASMLVDDTIGTFPDQCVDGLRADAAHYTHRGNTRLAEGWLQYLRQAALLSADIDGDGIVGITDFLLLLAAWGPCAAPPDLCPADLNGDGVVGIADFLALLSAWGSGG